MLVKKYKILGKCFSQVGDKTRFVMKIESTKPSHHPHSLKEHKHPHKDYTCSDDLGTIGCILGCGPHFPLPHFRPSSHTIISQYKQQPLLVVSLFDELSEIQTTILMRNESQGETNRNNYIQYISIPIYALLKASLQSTLLLSLLSSPRLPFSKSLAFEELWSLAKIVAYKDCQRWLLQAAAFHDLHKKQ